MQLTVFWSKQWVSSFSVIGFSRSLTLHEKKTKFIFPPKWTNLEGNCQCFVIFLQHKLSHHWKDFSFWSVYLYAWTLGVILYPSLLGDYSTMSLNVTREREGVSNQQKSVTYNLMALCICKYILIRVESDEWNVCGFLLKQNNYIMRWRSQWKAWNNCWRKTK